jgi:hypothetical protein
MALPPEVSNVDEVPSFSELAGRGWQRLVQPPVVSGWSHAAAHARRQNRFAQWCGYDTHIYLSKLLEAWQECDGKAQGFYETVVGPTLLNHGNLFGEEARTVAQWRDAVLDIARGAMLALQHQLGEIDDDESLRLDALLTTQLNDAELVSAVYVADGPALKPLTLEGWCWLSIGRDLWENLTYRTCEGCESNPNITPEAIRNVPSSSLPNARFVTGTKVRFCGSYCSNVVSRIARTEEIARLRAELDELRKDRPDT